MGGSHPSFPDAPMLYKTVKAVCTAFAERLASRDVQNTRKRYADSFPDQSPLMVRVSVKNQDLGIPTRYLSKLLGGMLVGLRNMLLFIDQLVTLVSMLASMEKEGHRPHTHIGCPHALM